MKNILLLLIVLISLSYSEVPSYMVHCDQEDYDQMIRYWWDEDIEIDCTVVHDDTVYTDARIRLRGDSSRGYPKKSYRITFSEQDPLNGRTRWNFNSEYMDHTYIHSWLFAWIMEQLEYPCFDVDHIRLYVNDSYIGLYVKTDPVDEQYLIENALDPQGNLYKAAVDGACLSIYDNVDEFWEKRTNTSEGWNDLYELIDYLDQVPPDSFHKDISEWFNVNRLLTIVAINTLTNNFSTYYHNYFMYHDVQGSGVWTMMPWDVDKTFGSWITRPFSEGVNAFWYDNPLFEKIILDPVLFELYFDRMQAITDEVINITVLGPVIDSLELELEQAIIDDSLDAIDIDEFHEEIEILMNDRIPYKMAAMLSQYDNAPRPFQAHRGDTLSLGDRFISWDSTEAMSGEVVTYNVYLSTSFGSPDSIVQEHIGIIDTCFTFTDLEPDRYIWTVVAKASSWYTEAYDHWNPLTVTSDYTELSGTLSGTTFLQKNNSPYLITGDIYIPYGSSLYIEGGVDIRVEGGVGFDCSGSMRSEGNSSDSVRFLANNSSQSWNGIKLSGDKADFTYTSFSNSTGSGGAGSNTACITALNTDLTMENCSFSYNKRCIQVSGGSAILDSCDLTGWNTEELFFMEAGISALITDSRFGNMINPPANYHDAVEFQNCTYGEYVVRNCEIFNIAGDGIDLNGSFLTAEDNLIWGIEDKGFSIGVNPVASTGSSEATLLRQIVLDCYEGISVKDGSVALIDRCTVSSCETGVRAYEKTAGYGGGNVTIGGSIFSYNLKLFSFEDGSVSSVNYSLTGNDEPWQGQGNIAADPGFTEWGDLDFHLSYTSPCIDSGDPSVNDPDGTRSDMGALFYPQVFDGLVINELQSLNETTIADEYGEYDDWLEIYNGSEYDCDLSWVYLSDDPRDLSLYRFPTGTVIPSGCYLVVWADGNWWQNGYHLPWRLSSQRDSLYFSRQPVESGKFIRGGDRAPAPELIDSITFGIIEQDWSLGRNPDGGTTWEFFSNPTPGFSNTIPYSQAGYLQVSNPFPNPALSGLVTLDLTVDAGPTVVSIYDISGRLVAEVMNQYLESGDYRIYWDTLRDRGSYVPSGIYLIHVRHAAGLSASRKIVVIRSE